MSDQPAFESTGLTASCTETADDGDVRIDADDFVPSPIVTTSGHVRHYEETYQWVKPLLPKVPVTRVLNVTPIDFVGLPVWSAVTPLAKDLTVHAGKGGTSRAAELSAIMEAIERVSGESVPPSATVRASYETQRDRANHAVLDPWHLCPPFETTYSPAQPLDWTLGFDIATQSHVWVPVDAVVSPARDGLLTGVETNGLASGNTITEATVHALYELIERDAVSIEQFSELHTTPLDRRATAVRMVDPKTLPEEPRSWVERLEKNGLRVTIQDLTTEFGVSVFAAFIIDNDFPGNEGDTTVFSGHGCDLNPDRAVFRAITEVTQSHSIVSLGARETFEGTRPLPDHTARLQRRLDILEPERFVPFRTDAKSTGDLLADLKYIVGRLAESGLEQCIVVNVTRDDLGVPVVRVIVPGLEHPYGSTTRRPGPRLLGRIA